MNDIQKITIGNKPLLLFEDYNGIQASDEGPDPFSEVLPIIIENRISRDFIFNALLVSKRTRIIGLLGAKKCLLNRVISWNPLFCAGSFSGDHQKIGDWISHFSESMKAVFKGHIYIPEDIKTLLDQKGCLTPEQIAHLEMKKKELDTRVVRQILPNQAQFLSDDSSEWTEELKRLEDRGNYLPTTMDDPMKLRLSFLELCSLPSEVFRLSHLTELNLSHNHLRKLSSKIGDLKNLKLLNLESNMLTSLPREIGDLTNLSMLILNDNQIKELPSEIVNLTNLENLMLHENQLTSLPPNFGNLMNLNSLWLAGNNFTKLPQGMWENFTNLRGLSLDKNITVPEKIYQQLRTFSYHHQPPPNCQLQ